MLNEEFNYFCSSPNITDFSVSANLSDLSQLRCRHRICFPSAETHDKKSISDCWQMEHTALYQPQPWGLAFFKLLACM